MNKVLRHAVVKLVKVLWRNHSIREATWELEKEIRENHPQSKFRYVKFRGLNFYKGGENVTPRNLYRHKLGKIIMTGICIGISYGK